jgi:hypothetical protein
MPLFFIPVDTVFRTVFYGFINQFLVITMQVADLDVVTTFGISKDIRGQFDTGPALRTGPEIDSRTFGQ